MLPFFCRHIPLWFYSRLGLLFNLAKHVALKEILGDVAWVLVFGQEAKSY